MCNKFSRDAHKGTTINMAEHLVIGRADVEPSLSAYAGLAMDAALVCGGADLDEGKVRHGGDTFGTATCLETGTASLQVRFDR